MANLKKWVAWRINWEGDGNGTQIVIDFLTDPVQFSPDTGNILTQSALAGIPSSVDDEYVAVSGATKQSSSYNAILGRLTVTLTAAPGDDVEGQVQGHAEYS